MIQFLIDDEFKGLIPPLAVDEFSQLEKNLLDGGWRDSESIIVWNDTIIDGHNRYGICLKHNIVFKFLRMNFVDRDAVKLWMIDNQLGRRNLSVFARGELGILKGALLKVLAKERQRVHGGTAPGKTLPPNSAEVIGKGDVRDEVAKLAKVSHDTIDKINFIKKNASDEVIQKLRSGNKELSINKVYVDIKKKELKNKILTEAKQAKNLDDVNKKYKIILADPPWKYFAGGNKNATTHYGCMDIEEIKKLPVLKLADDDCILFLWVTFPMLKDVFDVIEAWGFNYSTCGFVWVKKNKNDDNYFFGLGNWTRANAELCLIATRGKPIKFSASVSQIIDYKIDEHSKKPDVVRDKIVELAGDLPRIELFARKKVDGWDSWGNEI